MLLGIPYAPSMVDQLERTTNLLALLLETALPLTLDDIVNQLGGQYPPGHAAMRGAFERDKGLLRDIGVPIETEVLRGTQAGQTGYRVDRDRYELRGLDLTDEERRALQVAVAAARTTEAEFGMFKLGGVADSSASITANLPQLELLPALREAIAARATVSVPLPRAPRTLQPYALLLREGFWYVIGHDLGHDEVRTYRVDRIEGTVEHGEPRRVRTAGRLRPARGVPGGPEGAGRRRPGRDVRIDAPGDVRGRELGAEAVVRRHADGGVEVEVPCSQPRRVPLVAVRVGRACRGARPAGGARRIVDWLRAMASRS